MLGVKHCSADATHYTTAVQLAVLFRKPIIFVTTDQLSSSLLLIIWRRQGKWAVGKQRWALAKMRLIRWRLSRHRERTICRAYLLVAWVPGRVGIYLRRIVVQYGAHEVGSGLSLDTGIRITGWENISIGNNVSIMRLSALHAHNGKLRIGNNVSINANSCINPADGGHVEIADDVLIAQNVVIRASDHRHDAIDRPINQQGHTGGEIHIEEGVWIGANAVVTRDVRIGAHAIVGAGAVVTRDVAPFTIVGGVPARLFRHRIDQNKLPKPE